MPKKSITVSYPFLACLLTGCILVTAFAAKTYHEHNYKPDQQKIIDLFHKFYYSQWKRVYWLGVPIMQNPMDSFNMGEVIADVKPDVLIETGTYNGGSSLFYAMILEQVNPEGRIVSVDINPLVDKAHDYELFNERVKLIKGDSVSPEVLNAVKAEISENDVVMVTLDSLHKKHHVLKELELYSPLVTKGSYLVVQDTNINGHPVFPEYGPGPMEALEEFLKGNTDFVIDREREKHYLTFYPKGFLKRIK